DKTTGAGTVPAVPCGEGLELAGELERRAGRMSLHEQVDAIGHDLHRHHRPAVHARFRADQLPAASCDRASLPWTTAVQAPHDVAPEATYSTSANLHSPGHARDDTHHLCQNTRVLHR